MKKIYIFENPAGLIESIQDRPPTNLGSQGDHVSAYAIIKYSAKFFLNPTDTDIENAEKLAMERFLGILDSLLFNLHGLLTIITNEQAMKRATSDIGAIEKAIEFVQEEFRSLEHKEGYTTLAMFEKLESSLSQDKPLLDHVKALARGKNRSMARSILIEAANNYLRVRNAMRDVAYPREGNEAPPKEEAVNVKTAIKTLFKLELVCQQSFTAQSYPAFTRNNFIELHDSVFNLFWYPRISDTKIIAFKDDDELRAWQKENAYKKDALPRDNEIPNLFRQICSHLTLIFSCFPSLSQSPRANAIINEFKNKVTNQWELSENEQGELESLFKDNLPQNIRDEIDSAKTSSASDSGHSSDAGSDDSKDKETPPRPPRLRASMFGASRAAADSDESDSSYKEEDDPVTVESLAKLKIK